MGSDFHKKGILRTTITAFAGVTAAYQVSAGTSAIREEKT